MIVVMKVGSSDKEIDGVIKRIESAGLKTHVSQGVERTIIGVVGQIFPELQDMLEMLHGVDEVIRVSKPYKLSSREFHPLDTTIKVDGITIGGKEIVVIAGPCAVESEQQLLETAKAVKAAGASILRGGAFKPSTSPYQFRGLGERGLELLAKVKTEVGLPVITEVMTPGEVEMVARYSDILQIGARNMQNFNLLEEVGKTGKPIMLKRGLSATVQEWLLAAEYVLAQGNEHIMLCERGIRTFETYTRNTMDISVIPIIEKVSHLPIIADPSHGTGKWYLVIPMALAAVAAGADGIMVEVHPNPDQALKDGAQSLTFANFQQLIAQLKAVAEATGRCLASPSAETES
ncbi:MAG: 3-deoxy-7-phosphoheptulonate synthase [Chloroflexi bacterium RBG_13_50_10]|nr:MAG: 3-deoxy-7-phosphoheptulonate synthase [Chloroflexi bacterium RBG_13_50_10]